VVIVLAEYPDIYSVYELPESVESSISEGSWLFLDRTELTRLGQIPVKSVRFDETKRKALDPYLLDALAEDLDTPSAPPEP